MKMKKSALILLLSCLLEFATAAAQKSAGSAKTSPIAAYRLIGLKVTGTQRFTEKEILPASGLALGQNVAEADFKEAARRLGDTGLFTDVAYSFSFSPTGTKLELQLTDIEESKLIPAHFENFVWFTDAQLLTEIQRQERCRIASKRHCRRCSTKSRFRRESITCAKPLRRADH